MARDDCMRRTRALNAIDVPRAERSGIELHFVRSQSNRRRTKRGAFDLRPLRTATIEALPEDAIRRGVRNFIGGVDMTRTREAGRPGYLPHLQIFVNRPGPSRAA